MPKTKIVRVLTYEGTRDELRQHFKERWLHEHFERSTFAITEYYAEESQLNRIAFTPLSELLGGEKL